MQKYYKNLPEDEKIKKRNYANNRNNNMPDENRNRKKRQNLSNHLINCVKELEILVSINKFLNISE